MSSTFVARLNLVISVAIASSMVYIGKQKVLQIFLIWTVPVVGFVLIGLFMLTQRENAPRTDYPSKSGDDLSQIWSALHPTDQKN